MKHYREKSVCIRSESSYVLFSMQKSSDPREGNIFCHSGDALQESGTFRKFQCNARYIQNFAENYVNLL